MFLASTSVGATPRFYLVAGHTAVYLYDTSTVQAFKKVGIPVVTLAQPALDNLTTAFKPLADQPWAVFHDDGVDAVIDGGAPNTMLFMEDFDGGDSTTTDFGAPPIDGNHT